MTPDDLPGDQSMVGPYPVSLPFISLRTGRSGFDAGAYQLEASGTGLCKIAEPSSSVLKGLGL